MKLGSGEASTPPPPLPRLQQQAGPPQPDHPGGPEVAAGHRPDADETRVDDDERGEMRRKVTSGLSAFAPAGPHVFAAGRLNDDVHAASPPCVPPPTVRHQAKSRQSLWALL